MEYREDIHNIEAKKIKKKNADEYDSGNYQFGENNAVKKTVLTFTIKSNLTNDRGIALVKEIIDMITYKLSERGYKTSCVDCGTTENLHDYISKQHLTTLCSHCKEARIRIYKERATNEYLVQNEKALRGFILTFLLGILCILFLVFIQACTDSFEIALFGTGILTTLTLVNVYRWISSSFTIKSIVFVTFITAFYVTIFGYLIAFGYEVGMDFLMIYILWIITLIISCKLNYSSARKPAEVIEVN